LAHLVFDHIAVLCSAAPRNASKPNVADYIERLEKQTTQILKEYAKLHAKFSRCVIDISCLPADKQRIVEVIKLAWLTAEDDKTRVRLERHWMFLSQFQYDVGATPIQVFSRGSAKFHGGRQNNKNTGSRWYPLKASSSRVNANNSNKLKFANRLCDRHAGAAQNPPSR
jgi:hypothetical protein